MLYRTYRPQTWADVVGQSHVVRTLQGALERDLVSHAYLFAGPRGTGKTTMARIFARAINCTSEKGKPCGACSLCQLSASNGSLDIIEIDAASNRTIDDMRALKETLSVSPTLGTHKVYVVDEAHMITKEAFNAFLKMLEEPPKHVVFILATTEAHKIPATILSRVQKFDFHKLTPTEISSKLASIATAEKLQVSPDVLLAIANASDGAMRDAEVMLTKLAMHASDGSAVDASMLGRLLGLVPHTAHAELAEMLSTADWSGALSAVRTHAQQGADMDQFVRGLLHYLRLVMIGKIDGTALDQDASASIKAHATSMDGKLLVRAIEGFTSARAQMRTSPIATLPLELAIIELGEKK